MQFIILLFTLGHSLVAHPVTSAADLRACTDTSTRAAVKAAVQDRFEIIGLPRDNEVLALLSTLGDAHSAQSRNVAAVFQEKSGLPASAFKLCEVSDTRFDDPLFVTVLFVNPATGQPGGLVVNFGFPGATAEFGDRLHSVQS
ncbi:hypothetical protein P7D22_03885 [Lichenihabitans sp. Uapishka_5]|uniref:hypothetical protein n=1 Tax=Lichenihabitans sp. Uapishka_5 TaxID=3037302 RepID=UPI0029E7FB38|nr:hypothetical protein [Lichenihabitans sp. Uapishka_5]MDX7950320.1 hypothetical protein [Lichenihabitans sp. Uapishka_5]